MARSCRDTSTTNYDVQKSKNEYFLYGFVVFGG